MVIEQSFEFRVKSRIILFELFDQRKQIFERSWFKMKVLGVMAGTIGPGDPVYELKLLWFSVIVEVRLHVLFIVLSANALILKMAQEVSSELLKEILADQPLNWS